MKDFRSQKCITVYNTRYTCICILLFNLHCVCILQLFLKLFKNRSTARIYINFCISSCAKMDLIYMNCCLHEIHVLLYYVIIDQTSDSYSICLGKHLRHMFGKCFPLLIQNSFSPNVFILHTCVSFFNQFLTFQNDFFSAYCVCKVEIGKENTGDLIYYTS